MTKLCRVVPVLLALAFLVSCGSETEKGIVEAQSMEEALSLAARDNSFVVIEFWMDG
jgi:hypothetical protein